MRMSESTTLTGNELKALLAFASKDNSRPSLGRVAVYQTDAGIDFAATDGHTLVVRAHTPSPALSKPPVATIPTSYATKLVKLAGGSGEICIDVGEGRAGVDGMSCPLDPPGVFPPVAQVIPSEVRAPKDASWGVNADYLARLALITRTTAAVAKTVVCEAPATALDPTVYRVTNTGADVYWLVVIMPVRI